MIQLTPSHRAFGVILSLVALAAIAYAVLRQPATYTATVEKTYCNGSTGYCTTDPTDSRLKNPANAPEAPGVPLP